MLNDKAGIAKQIMNATLESVGADVIRVKIKKCRKVGMIKLLSKFSGAKVYGRQFDFIKVGKGIEYGFIMEKDEKQVVISLGNLNAMGRCLVPTKTPLVKRIEEEIRHRLAIMRKETKKYFDGSVNELFEAQVRYEKYNTIRSKK